MSDDHYQELSTLDELIGPPKEQTEDDKYAPSYATEEESLFFRTTEHSGFDWGEENDPPADDPLYRYSDNHSHRDADDIGLLEPGNSTDTRNSEHKNADESTENSANKSGAESHEEDANAPSNILYHDTATVTADPVDDEQDDSDECQSHIIPEHSVYLDEEVTPSDSHGLQHLFNDGATEPPNDASFHLEEHPPVDESAELHTHPSQKPFAALLGLKKRLTSNVAEEQEHPTDSELATMHQQHSHAATPIGKSKAVLNISKLLFFIGMIGTVIYMAMELHALKALQQQRAVTVQDHISAEVSALEQNLASSNNQQLASVSERLLALEADFNKYQSRSSQSELTLNQLSDRITQVDAHIDGINSLITTDRNVISSLDKKLSDLSKAVDKKSQHKTSRPNVSKASPTQIRTVHSLEGFSMFAIDQWGDELLLVLVKGGQIKRLKIGQQLHGWTVRAINSANRQATLAKGRSTLHLRG